MSTTRSPSPRLHSPLIDVVLATALLILLAGAFVQLDASSYWVDELWSLFVADPTVAPTEVLRRAQMDLHPPAYHFLLDAWMRLFGDSETASRGLSALCAVAAILSFVSAAGPAFSRAARLFGGVAGAASFFWFDQAQNVRSYGLAMLCLSALLECALRAKAQEQAGIRPSLAVCTALCGLGLIGAFTHYYLFVAVGLLYFVLILTISDARLRLILAGWGVAVAMAVLSFILAQQQTTVFTSTWFSNDLQFLLAGLQNALWSALGRWSKRMLALLIILASAAFAMCKLRGNAKVLSPQQGLRRWLGVVSLTITVGLAGAGLVVSLVLVPSFSGRNLLIASPCLWRVAAWIYDECLDLTPRPIGLALAAAAAACSVLDLAVLEGRRLNRKEDWRGSASYIGALTACSGRDMPVVVPQLFAPDTPFYRRLAAERFYGRYYRGGGVLVPVTAAELVTHRDARLTKLLAARSRGDDACPALAWAVHDLDDGQAKDLARALSERPEVRGPVKVRSFPAYVRSGDRWRPIPSGAYVFEVAPSDASPSARVPAVPSTVPKTVVR